MKIKKYRVAAFFMAAVMMIGVLTACGAEPKVEKGEVIGGKAEGSAAFNPAKPPENVKLKDNIVIGMQSKHTTVDPMEASNTQHNYMWRMVFDTPIHFNNETSKLEPALATEWSTNDNGKTFVFKLRKDVKFHNGEILKASDFVFTFKRMKGTTANNGVYEKIQNVEATDDYTVKMVLVDPNVDWPYMMTLPTASIMNEKAVKDDPKKGPGVGTGPWKIDSYEFGNYTKLVSFNEGWRGAPRAKSFTFRYIPDVSSRLIALQNGEIDICQEPSTVEIPNINNDENLDLITYKGGSLTYLAFNTKKAPADNESLRKAVAYGIDVDSIIKVAAEGYGQKATSFWGWNEYGYHDYGGYTRDVAKAKEYVAKAYPNGGAALNISVGDPVRKTIAEMMQSQLKEVGINVTITELDSAGISTSTTKGDHQSAIYGMGFNIFGDDARRILQPGSAVNKAHYDSKEVMDLLDKAVAETNETKRKEYYKQIQGNVYEHVPYIPLYFADGFIAVAKGTGGIDAYPTSHHDFSNVFVPAKSK